MKKRSKIKYQKKTSNIPEAQESIHVKSFGWKTADPAPKKHRKSKRFSFIGFCGRCKCMIMNSDKISTFIYHCPSCGKEERTKYLKLAIISQKNKILPPLND